MSPKNKSDEELVAQARYIIETGKLIHERVVHSRLPQVITGRSSGDRKKKVLYELSIAQLHAVQAVHEHKSVSITQLAGLLKVSAPSASVMVERLVEKGVLMRERNPADRRKVVVRIAPDLTVELERLERNVLESFIDLLQELGPETAREWCSMLTRVKAVIEAKHLSET